MKYYLLVDWGSDGYQVNELDTLKELQEAIRTKTFGNKWKAIKGKELELGVQE